MITVGTKVRIKDQFRESFPDVYEVIEVVDGNTFILDFGYAFDASYLEVVE